MTIDYWPGKLYLAWLGLASASMASASMASASKASAYARWLEYLKLGQNSRMTTKQYKSMPVLAAICERKK